MAEKYPVIPLDERKPLGWLFSPAKVINPLPYSTTQPIGESA